MTDAPTWLWEARRLLNGGGLPGGEGAVIDPENRAAVRSIITEHALHVVFETRQRIDVCERTPGGALVRPYKVTALRMDARELHLGIADTLLRWDRARRDQDSDRCPDVLTRWPDVTWAQIADMHGRSPADRGLRALAYELDHASAARAGNGTFGSAYTHDDPTVQLLAQLLTDRLGSMPLSIDLDTGRPRRGPDALAHADLVDVVLAEHALASRDRGIPRPAHPKPGSLGR